MVSVRVNGSDTPVRVEGLSRMTDLVELMKNMIDPDHMISTIKVNGAPISESQWTSSVSQLGTAIIEFDTCSPEQYVRHGLTQAPKAIYASYEQFRRARESFQQGRSVDGNTSFVKAIEIIKSFFQFYGTLIQLVPKEQRQAYSIDSEVLKIAEISREMSQHQTYQAWWKLSETIEKKLEPELDKLFSRCEEFQEQQAA